MKMNRDTFRRDQLLDIAFKKCEEKFSLKFGGSIKAGWSGGIRRFEGLDYVTLETLSNEGFVDLNERQNNSPKISFFLDFMKRFPQVTAEGYAVADDRPDYRISIDGISCDKSITDELMREFYYLCQHSDEYTFNEEELRAWWD